MKRLLSLFLVLPLILFAQIDPKVIRNIAGIWIITQYFPAKNITDPREQVLQYIGQPIKITNKGIGFDGLDDSDCTFAGTEVHKEDFNVLYKDTQKKYGLPTFLPLQHPFTGIYTGCNEVFYDQNIDKYILFFSDNYFFKAVRTSNPIYNISIQNLTGQWKVTQWLAGLSDLTPADINSLMGKTLTIGPQSISLETSLLTSEDRSCSFDSIDTGWVTNHPIDYFNDNYGSMTSGYGVLNLKIPFWTLHSTCMSVFTTSNPNKIVFAFGEDFFNAIRAANS